MFFDIHLPHYTGLVLVLVMIFFGHAFRKNWKNKEYLWILKAWIYGLLSSISFFLLILLPLDFQT
tara:strand:- start:185 stop:379 length:195 start_codon:yes stop_codon:yes gene_type:complete